MTAAMPGQADMAALVRAAQAADHATRPARRNWTRVGDDQVARLIGGAQAALIAAQEPHAAGEATGQAAYEVWRAAVPDVVCNVPGGAWEDLPATVQAGFSAIAAREPHAAPELAEMRERLEAAEAAKRAAKGELAALGDRLAQAIAAAVKAERERAEAAEAKVAQYENGITWDTTCLSCATVLDSAIQETFRRERAEAKISEARDGIGNFLAQYGDSEIPMFKVGQDLANATLKILGDAP